MWKIRSISAAVASAVIAGTAAGLAAARADTLDRDHRRDEAQERVREVRLDLPRTAAGAIDVDKLAAEIRAALAAGAHEIRIRDAALSAADMQALRQAIAQFDFERVRIREDGNRVQIGRAHV